MDGETHDDYIPPFLKWEEKGGNQNAKISNLYSWLLLSG
jgi:hypothetical protein